ncbi:MAG: aldose 1-epimerase [Clostridia bacterium]|nr:aldose 1-epimerase [Clostridia bacterium]
MSSLITLRSPDGAYEVKIQPQRGANCLRFEHIPSGISALRTYDPEAVEELDNAFLYGTPLLFPPNRIKGGKFTYEGREYSLPINEEATECFLHGTLHETPFEVVSQSESSVICRFEATDSTPYLTYPHAFTLLVKYELCEKGLKQTVSITNNSDLTMPVGLAFHTTFAMPFINGGDVKSIRMTLPVGEEYDRDMSDFSMTWETVNDADFHARLTSGNVIPAEQFISRHFSRPQGAALRLTDTKSGYSVVYDADDSFKYWMVYNGGDERFLCVEPQTWINSAPQAPAKMGDVNIIGIKPSETRDFVTYMYVEK